MDRRGWFRRLGVIAGSVLGVLAVLSGAAYLWEGRRRRALAAMPFKRVARLAGLAAGTPKQVGVFDIPPGTWSLRPPRLIGQVWLVRRDGDAVEAYTARCPHAGGSIVFEGGRFRCQLHGAEFDGACRRVPRLAGGRANPAPRDMDPLEVRQVTEAGTGEVMIEVHYQDFQTGRPDRVIISG